MHNISHSSARRYLMTGGTLLSKWPEARVNGEGRGDIGSQRKGNTGDRGCEGEVRAKCIV